MITYTGGGKFIIICKIEDNHPYTYTNYTYGKSGYKIIEDWFLI
jgi:hypothetical protein